MLTRPASVILAEVGSSEMEVGGREKGMDSHFRGNDNAWIPVCEGITDGDGMTEVAQRI